MMTPAIPPHLSPSPLPAPAADTPPAGYGDFLAEVKTQIHQRQFQLQALRAVNRELLAL